MRKGWKNLDPKIQNRVLELRQAELEKDPEVKAYRIWKRKKAEEKKADEKKVNDMVDQFRGSSYDGIDYPLPINNDIG